MKARAAAYNQLFELIVTAPDELRERLTRKTLPGQASLCARLRPGTTRLHEPLQAAKLALRSVAERSLELDRDIRRLDQHLSQLLATVVPRTLSLLGVSTGHASTLLVAAGQNIDRLRSEAAFSHLCAANPIPASSGRTTRHRLNRGGNREANRSLSLSGVIHEGAGLVKVGVMVRGCWCAGSLSVSRSGREVLQSSIRPRGAGQSVVRCSGAQSSGRPFCVSEAMTHSELA